MARRSALAALAALAAPAAASADALVFGSYGRIGVGTDLDGSTPEAVNVVRHGARVVESPYLELDFVVPRRAAPDLDTRTVITLAVLGEPFHYTGVPDATIALRNLYVEAILPRGLSLWVGSRMYRGDDIYLLDWWPLDHANTVGAGARWVEERLDVGVHVGASRLIDPFQFQLDTVPGRERGETTIVMLDRQRLGASAKAAYRLWGAAGGPGAKVKIHLAVEGLPSGVRERPDGTKEPLPDDFGWTAGAQLGAWGFCPSPFNHANLFLRFSQGLTAFSDLAVPGDVGPDRRVFPGASELVIGLGANHETARAGVLAGGYLRRFQDADRNDADEDDGWEYILDARPYVSLTRAFQAAVDVSFQQRLPEGPSPTALRTLRPSVFQIAPMLLLSPSGAGSYARPQLRLVYRAAWLDEGARDLYPLDDPRRDRAWVHFLGVQAEWWFNSSYR